MKFIPCRKCYHKPNTRVPEGYIEKMINGSRVVTECDCHIKWRAEVEFRRRYENAGLRPDLIDASYPADYVGSRSRDSMLRLVNYVSKFSRDEAVRKCMLYLAGDNGCQKTLLANWVGKEVLRAGYDVQFILMNRLVSMLATLEADESQKRALDRVLRADLIIIDEAFDLEKLTIYKSGFQIPFVDSFLRDTIDKRGVIFVSNKEPKSIDSKFGKSVSDLLSRKTEYYHSLLKFTDNWADNKGEPPSRGELF
jgi:DNA replication protein DnaC